MCASRTPAAIDTSSGRCVRSTGARSCTTVCMIWGLTASTTVAHRDATSSLSLPALIPNRPVRSSSFAVSGSNAQMVPGGVPVATSPPMRLAPMLPPPTNPMFASLIPATFHPAPIRATHYRASGHHRKSPRRTGRRPVARGCATASKRSARDRRPKTHSESGLPGCADHRGPKIAVPTRTTVAPSATAASRSPVIPIDSVSSSNPLEFKSSRISRS